MTSENSEKTDVGKNSIPLNEVFDILPLRGCIDPQKTEKIEFSYLAVPNKIFSVIAVCRVNGGPDYFVKIRSEASEVNYKIHLSSREKFINLKEVSINTRILQYFEIENTSKVFPTWFNMIYWNP